jgi:hypothetical protein
MTNSHNPDAPADTAPAGPGASVGQRITGEQDARDPDGLITLDDLPDRLGNASDLGDLARKATQYGDAPAHEGTDSKEN